MTHFICFHSVLGGLGKTNLLRFTGWRLAQEGARVLLLDMNLESPTLSYLQEPRLGVVDMLLDGVQNGCDAAMFQDPLGNSLDPYILGPYPDGTSVMTAGLLDKDYPTQECNLDIEELYRVGHGLPLMLAFKQILSSLGYDVVLVDTTPGWAAISGITVRDIADTLILVVDAVDPFLQSSCHYLRVLQGVRAASLEDPKKNFCPRRVEALFMRAHDDETRIQNAVSHLSEAWGEPLTCHGGLDPTRHPSSYIRFPV